MAENTADKEALKAAKEAKKAAEKAKQERIKQSKPKKEGSVFSRAGKSVKKFWKDFAGTCKKIVWPSGTQVLKNSGVVLATILVVGLIVFGMDQGLTALFGVGSDLAINLGDQVAADNTTIAETTTASAAGTTVAGETTTAAAEETTAAGETTTAAAETTTAAAETTTLVTTTAAE